MFSKGLYLFLVVTLSLILVPAFGCSAPSGNEVQMKAAVEKIQKGVQAELDKLDADIADASLKLKSTGLSGDGARQILNGLCAKYPYLVDCSTVDLTGKVVTMAPDAFRKYEGSNIGTQDVKTPVLSPYLNAVEGVMAVSLMRPVVDEKGQQIGIIDALFTPKALLADIIAPVLKGTGLAMNVLQTDGLTIYDLPENDSGKNLLTDAEYKPYKDLVALGSRFVAEESGTGTYTYPSHETAEPTKKLAVWSSVNLHGTAWRMIAVQEN
ncbi:MAG: cache domain-containing protein [Chloroflexi bacterium]|nr:cache domain-containing protein [Chloroflexota bacterium]